MTEKEIIQTWKSLDRLSRKMVPSFLDRESLVSAVLIRFLSPSGQEKPSGWLMRMRFFDALRRESKYDRKTRKGRRAVSVPPLAFELNEYVDHEELEDKEEIDMLMDLVSWSSQETSLLSCVFYEGLSLRESASFMGITLRHCQYVWLLIQKKLSRIKRLFYLKEGELKDGSDGKNQ